MTTNSASTRETFEVWIVAMDDVLDEFMAALPAPIRARLDYSPESLDVVENWLIEHFETPEALRAAETLNLDGAARYIGETLRKNLGGHWTVELDDPKFVYHGLPILTGFKGENSPFSPHSLTSAATDRRTGTYLRTILNNVKKRAAA